MTRDATVENKDLKLHVRGKLNACSPVYELCKATGASVFKSVLTLAEEAVAVRSQISRMQEGNHPLGPVLSGMKSAEAVAYLLGMTLKHASADAADLSHIGRGEPGDKIKPVATTLQPGVQAVQSATQCAQAPTEDEESWDCDMADVMDVLSGPPDFKP